MKINMKQALVGTVVKNALKNMKDNPDRGIRNLVDMTLQFSEGRFRRQFFSAAQTMLQNENSAYYELVRNIITYTDTERLYTFCMNLGYNGCTMGAGRIRKNEEALGFNIPWTIAVRIGDHTPENGERSCYTVIQEGQNLGVYVWMLFSAGHMQEALDLARANPDSAFFLFCEPEDLTGSVLDDASELNNIMFVIRYHEDSCDLCRSLRDMGFLYSVWYSYGRESLDIILNEDLFYCIQELNPIFTVLAPEPTCPEEIRRQVHQHVMHVRELQKYHTIPWELPGDNCMIDAVISGDACSVCFDENGNLCGWDGKTEGTQTNLYRICLKDILMNTRQKEKIS